MRLIFILLLATFLTDAQSTFTDFDISLWNSTNCGGASGNIKGNTSITDLRCSVGCTALKGVDTAGLSNVTNIGSNFLHSCTSITTIDTRGLSKVTTIGAYFLAYSTNLTSIDTQGLSNVTNIGIAFLAGCTKLTSIDTRGLSNVMSIGNTFLTGCTSLMSINTVCHQYCLS